MTCSEKQPHLTWNGHSPSPPPERWLPVCREHYPVAQPGCKICLDIVANHVKDAGGFLPSLKGVGPQLFLEAVTMLKDRVKSEETPHMNTGKFACTLPRKPRSRGLNEFSESMECTPSSPSPSGPLNMSGKRTPESLEPSSSSESCLSNGSKSTNEEMNDEIGTESGSMQSSESLDLSQPRYEYVISELSNQSLQRTVNQLLSREQLWFTGALLVVENRIRPGMKRAWMLTLKIPSQSGGQDIQVRNMLSLMNFEVLSRSPMPCDGLMGIRSYWKQKEPVSRQRTPKFGLPATFIQSNGTQTLTRRPGSPCADG